MNNTENRLSWKPRGSFLHADTGSAGANYSIYFDQCSGTPQYVASALGEGIDLIESFATLEAAKAWAESVESRLEADASRQDQSS